MMLFRLVLMVALAVAMLIFAPANEGVGQRPPHAVVCRDLCRDRASSCRRHCDHDDQNRACVAHCTEEEERCYRTCARVSAEE